MPVDPLITTVIDLDEALGGGADLLLAGGLGLYLKQRHLQDTGARTLLPSSRWPTARTTQDIDLVLRAEIVLDSEAMSRHRSALDTLGFEVVPGVEWMKFKRVVDGRDVIVDIMVGPLGPLEPKVKRDAVRVRPPGSKGLHARATDDALGVEHEPRRIKIVSGDRSSEVLVPQAFPYALMKLGALRDRINDADKDEGRHHALDLYRIVAMLTEDEDAVANTLARRHAGEDGLLVAIRVIEELLAPANGLGRIRMREHPLCPPDADADWLASELLRLLGPPSA
ncbi:MAG: hypothetical protein EA376_01765 [Phycisphaeraceae bacterium]|nr:MAG: hypothetical protein EA376_01765 [Phycisphaeraceae bacterium]